MGFESLFRSPFVRPAAEAAGYGMRSPPARADLGTGTPLRAKALAEIVKAPAGLDRVPEARLRAEALAENLQAPAGLTGRWGAVG